MTINAYGNPVKCIFLLVEGSVESSFLPSALSSASSSGHVITEKAGDVRSIGVELLSPLLETSEEIVYVMY